MEISVWSFQTEILFSHSSWDFQLKNLSRCLSVFTVTVVWSFLCPPQSRDWELPSGPGVPAGPLQAGRHRLCSSTHVETQSSCFQRTCWFHQDPRQVCYGLDLAATSDTHIWRTGFWKCFPLLHINSCSQCYQENALIQLHHDRDQLHLSLRCIFSEILVDSGWFQCVWLCQFSV